MTDLARRVPHPHTATETELISSVVNMVQDRDYPCLGARSVMARATARFGVYHQLASTSVTEALRGDLADFVAQADLSTGFASYVAVFRAPLVSDEREFERLLWRQLQLLHDADGEPWNAQVSSDPADERFAFSLGGTAFFVVGLHPGASRDARRTSTPTLVFNLHEQFEWLRESGGFVRMRDIIRVRDQRLQGSLNPMTADHGDSSEARQYSGRQVARSWSAPFSADPTAEQSDHRTECS